MKNIRYIAFVLTFGTFCQTASALPIGFGRNQGDLEFDEIISPNFSVYFDRRAPQEGQAITNSLEAGKPTLEQWFAVKRKKNLPVIVSSTTSNASFANFITDALELQTLGRGGRDLAWHELTHNIMYRHLDNFFGPVGNIIHLPWMPAWWLEGLAEATSHSIGSDQMYSVERFTALANKWPSYDKLHSLYQGPFSYTGYAISGAFVSYILRTYGAEKLPSIMEDFFDYTLPWWWPWTMVPFNDFMPMDASLAKHTGKTGEELYEEYKIAATSHWRKQGLPELFRNRILKEKRKIKSPKKAGSRGSVWSGSALQVRNDKLFNMFFFNDIDALYEVEVQFKENGYKTINKKRHRMPEYATTSRITYGETKVFVKQDYNDNLDPFSIIKVKIGKKIKSRFKRLGYIRNLTLGPKKVFWLEVNRESNRICSIDRDLIFGKGKIKQSMVSCPIKDRYPTKLSVLGQRFSKASKDSYVDALWLLKTKETIWGDHYEIVEYNLATGKASIFENTLEGKPLSIAFQNNKILLLLSDRAKQFVRVFDSQRQCQKELLTANHLTQILASSQYIYGVSTENSNRWIYRTAESHWKQQACQQASLPQSPLLYSMQNPGTSFASALKANDPWTSTQGTSSRALQAKLKTSPALHKHPSVGNGPKEANWRGRPVFAFPWIGADAEGYQFGTISVPLMDHLQNETVTLTALYGLQSNYPNLELNVQSTRFKTGLAAKAFRRQAWNGSFLGSTFYFDERGIDLTASRFFRGPGISAQFGATAVDRLPYIGDAEIWPFVAHGYATEFYANLGQNFRLGDNSLSYSVSSRVSPKELNDNFKYDKLSAGTTLSVPIRLLGMGTRQSYGLTYGRTRGTRRPLLREVYRPLKTFIPGSGGGFNEINIGLLGPGALTSAKYGDTQARFKWAWTFPLVSQLETLIHIFYLERLDFTAFFNYGNAWNQNIKPAPEDFIKAHGYNLDLQSDIKGVTVNLGLGAGQVFGEGWEMYFLFGFDALINP